MSLAPPDSVSTSTPPYCPTNVKVLEVTAKFQSKSNAEQQRNVASLSSASGVGSTNCSSVSSVEQAVLKSEENIDLATTADLASSTGLAMAERSPTRSALTNGEGMQIQQLPGNDREGVGCGSVCFVDSALPSTASAGNQECGNESITDKSIGEKAAINGVDKSDDGAREVDCCSSPTQSMTASTTVSPERVETERLATEAAGGWRRPRGRGRGRMISLPSPGSRVNDTTVGSQLMEGTSPVWGGRIGRGRARSIMLRSNIGIEEDSSIEGAVGCLERGNGAETKENGCATMFQPCEHLDPERSVGVAETGAIGGEELPGTPRIMSGDQECGSDISLGEFSDGHLQLTSTATHSQTVSNDSHLDEALARPPTTQLHNVSAPAVVDAQSCQGCTALQVSHQRLNSAVTAMEIELSKLREMVTELNQRLDQVSKQKISKSSYRQPDETFTDTRLMRVKAAALITGRPISAHMCKQLVLNIHDYEPPCTFNSDDIKSINDDRECRDAQSLSKWAVFEMFSLQELVGRNCLGGGHDISTDGNAEMKKPFDECKMRIIKNAVFTLYPQQTDAGRKAVWRKCVDKINTDVRYLFKVSLKKHEWLQLGF